MRRVGIHTRQSFLSLAIALSGQSVNEWFSSCLEVLYKNYDGYYWVKSFGASGEYWTIGKYTSGMKYPLVVIGDDFPYYLEEFTIGEKIDNPYPERSS